MKEIFSIESLSFVYYTRVGFIFEYISQPQLANMVKPRAEKLLVLDNASLIFVSSMGGNNLLAIGCILFKKNMLIRYKLAGLN